MRRASEGLLVLGAIALIAAAASAVPLASSAQAEDFFSTLFGAFGLRPPPPPRAPLDDGLQPPSEAPPPRVGYGGGRAWCVRTCDGRYFPITGPDNESRDRLCHNFCPTADTKLVYGGDIDNAVTTTGRPYADLPNAFRYRKEMVAGCTCNGKDQTGLSPIKIEDDPTLRSGDIVVGSNGLVIANRSARAGVAVNFSPLPEKLRARFHHVPVVARGR